MKMKIAENIRTLRKQHSFTQEQLSEALGVTVSAVYKWESAQSVPEVKMLMELADLFEISVDTLLGYDRQNENVENRMKRIEQYVVERDFEEAILEAEKTLKKYPNKFDAVYVAASTYMIAYSENKNKEIMERAVELFYSAIPLLYQNKSGHINETTILNAIGNLYLTAGQKEKGMEILKQNNVCGINSAAIGLIYAMMKQPEEAKAYLYQAYVDNINSTIYTMCGMLLMYGAQKNEQYLQVGEWLLQFLNSLVKDKEKVTFIDKLKAILFAQMAVIAGTFKEYDKVETYITHAYQYAIKFDAKPNYSPLDIQFLVAEDIPTLLVNSLGETAMEAIEHYVLEKAEPGEALEHIKNKFEVLKNEGITE